MISRDSHGGTDGHASELGLSHNASERCSLALLFLTDMSQSLIAIMTQMLVDTRGAQESARR